MVVGELVRRRQAAMDEVMMTVVDVFMRVKQVMVDESVRVRQAAMDVEVM